MPRPTDAITTEARSVAEAVQLAATELGVPASLVQHELDFSHFRNEAGSRVPRDTVKIFAWARDASETEGLVAGIEWLKGLIEKMGLKATIKGTVPEDKVADIQIDSSDARHLVGRRGITLQSIQSLLLAAMADEFGEWKFRIDIQGGDAGRERGRGRDDRPRDGRRDDRRRDDRRRDDHRRDGRRRDGRRDDRSRDDRPRDGERRSSRDLDKLRQLARRLAEQALETGETVEIRRQLNSFERRVVHIEIADIEGVVTESVGEGPHKQVVIRAADKD